jgi:hypothetical protein
MINGKHVWTAMALGGMVSTLGAGGCSASETLGVGETLGADGADVDALEGQQLITSTNADGTWTSNATITIEQLTCKPSFSWEGYAGATFTGPAGKTRRMGACALREAKTASGSAKACNTVADCAASPEAPASLPSGGFRYCTAANGTGQKYCYYRPGPATTWCAGTPAMAGAPPVAPGYYGLQFNPPGGTKWISYGCFEGCAVTDPSSSSIAKSAIQDLFCP